MTSIPASRSARAMIFAPRSWPSSPGLAIKTRIFFSGISVETRSFPLQRGITLSDSHFFVSAENLAHGVANFAERGVGLHGIVNERHEIIFAFGGFAQRGQAPRNFLLRSLCAQFAQPLRLPVRDRLIDLQNFQRLFLRDK